jgi:hypothetical protein
MTSSPRMESMSLQRARRMTCPLRSPSLSISMMMMPATTMLARGLAIQAAPVTPSPSSPHPSPPYRSPSIEPPTQPSPLLQELVPVVAIKSIGEVAIAPVQSSEAAACKFQVHDSSHCIDASNEVYGPNPFFSTMFCSTTPPPVLSSKASFRRPSTARSIPTPSSWMF